MPRDTKIINMSLPEGIYREVGKLAQRRKISRSELLRRALKEYVISEQRWQQIRKWGEKTAKDFGIRNEKDVEKLIYELRKNSA